MRAKIVTVASSKGGVGKTTTAATLAVYFARTGKRVLLVDLDGQGHAAAQLGYVVASDALTAAHVLMNKATIVDARQAVRPNLDLVPADERMVEAEHHLQGVPGRRTLLLAIKRVQSDYDLVMIDTAPASSLSAITQNGVYAADFVICPVQTTQLSVETLDGFYETLVMLQQHLDWQADRSITDFSMIVPTMFHTNGKADKAAREKILAFCDQDWNLMPVTINDSASIRKAAAVGQTVIEYEPRSTGADDYVTLAKCVDARIGV